MVESTINRYYVGIDASTGAYYVKSTNPKSTAVKHFVADEQGLTMAELYASKLNAASDRYEASKIERKI